MAIAADSMHYKADLLVNLSVAAAVILTSSSGLTWLDPLVGFAIAAYIVWNALGIATDALDVLLDRELPEEDRKRIRAIATSHPQVHGCHDLRTRIVGA